MKTAVAALIGVAVGAWSVAFATAAPPLPGGRIQWTCILAAGCFAYRDDTGEVISYEPNPKAMFVVGKRP